MNNEQSTPPSSNSFKSPPQSREGSLTPAEIRAANVIFKSDDQDVRMMRRAFQRAVKLERERQEAEVVERERQEAEEEEREEEEAEEEAPGPEIPFQARVKNVNEALYQFSISAPDGEAILEALAQFNWSVHQFLDLNYPEPAQGIPADGDDEAGSHVDGGGKEEVGA